MISFRFSIKITLFFLFLNLISVQTKAADYILNLKPQDWKLQAKGFYLKSVVDERNEKTNGVAMVSGAKIPVKFKNSLENDLADLIRSSTSFDSTGIPLVLGIQLFALQEKGTMSRHTASLLVKAHFYREHNGKLYEIVELESKPALEMSGPVPLAQETIIQNAMKDFISNLIQMLKESPNMSQMATAAKVIIDPLPNSYFNKRDTLYWNPKLRLKWSDFKGPIPESPFSAESSCVFTYTASTNMNNSTLEIHVQIAACFNTYNSWVKPELKRDTLLMHEQLHFDICENEIRKLKKTLSEASLDPFDFDVQIRSAFNEAWTKYKDIQHLYDEETQHGIVLDKQSEWMNRITLELNAPSEN